MKKTTLTISSCNQCPHLAHRVTTIVNMPVGYGVKVYHCIKIDRMITDDIYPNQPITLPEWCPLDDCE